MTPLLWSAGGKLSTWFPPGRLVEQKPPSVSALGNVHLRENNSSRNLENGGQPTRLPPKTIKMLDFSTQRETFYNDYYMRLRMFWKSTCFDFSKKSIHADLNVDQQKMWDQIFEDPFHYISWKQIEIKSGTENAWNYRISIKVAFCPFLRWPGLTPIDTATVLFFKLASSAALVTSHSIKHYSSSVMNSPCTNHCVRSKTGHRCSLDFELRSLPGASEPKPTTGSISMVTG